MRRFAFVSCIVLLIQVVLWMPPLARTAEKNAIIPQGLPIGRLGAQLDRETEQGIVSVLQGLGGTLILERTRGQADVEVYSRAAPAVVLVADAEGKPAGSGAIIDAEGHILTNWHVVRDLPRVLVVLKPRDSTELRKELVFVAVVEKRDEVVDLALLRILTPPPSLKFLQLGDAKTLAVGQDVHAIGHPELLTWTYTKGIISQIRDNYEWSYGDRRMHRAKVIQTQTPINPGNSGGPLLDDSGRLIAINSFGSTQAQGLNFAVAIDTIEEFRHREGSRTAPQVEQRGNAEPQRRCPDAYDTTGRGWKNFVGCYRTDSPPPPDLWFVYQAPQQVAYMAVSNLRNGQIDTVIRSPEQKWEELIHLIDVDCNGTIDLIGYQGKGSDGITSFSLPPNPMRMLTLAKELDTALKLGKIPYRNLRVCQGNR